MKCTDFREKKGLKSHAWSENKQSFRFRCVNFAIKQIKILLLNQNIRKCCLKQGFWLYYPSSVVRRQRGRAVRALDLQFKVPPLPLAGFFHGSPEFKSLSTLVNSCSLFASGQLEFLTPLCLIWIICFNHLLGLISIFSAVNTTEDK